MRDEERPGTPPLFRVVSGHPAHEEVAALAAALTLRRAAAARQAAQAGAAGRSRQAGSGWADRRRRLGIPPVPGPGAWRRSARAGRL